MPRKGQPGPPQLLLASASPRRRALLAAAGLPFDAVESGFDEASLRHLAARPQAVAAAIGKAEQAARAHPGRWVVGADTVVAVGGRALGQPGAAAEAAAMLRLLSGREHAVVSSVAVLAPDGRRDHATAIARVAVAPLDEAAIRRYVATGEPFDKAGAYAIQGRAGTFAGLRRGSLDAVIGLPVAHLRRVLRRLGYPLPPPPRPRPAGNRA